jgi:hypothetical protein
LRPVLVGLSQAMCTGTTHPRNKGIFGLLLVPLEAQVGVAVWCIPSMTVRVITLVVVAGVPCGCRRCHRPDWDPASLVIVASASIATLLRPAAVHCPRVCGDCHGRLVVPVVPRHVCVSSHVVRRFCIVLSYVWQPATVPWCFPAVSSHTWVARTTNWFWRILRPTCLAK